MLVNKQKTQHDINSTQLHCSVCFPLSKTTGGANTQKLAKKAKEKQPNEIFSSSS